MFDAAVMRRWRTFSLLLPPGWPPPAPLAVEVCVAAPGDEVDDEVFGALLVPLLFVVGSPPRAVGVVDDGDDEDGEVSSVLGCFRSLQMCTNLKDI